MRARITDEIAAEVRRRHAAGETLTAIAAAIGISRASACNIAADVRRPKRRQPRSDFQPPRGPHVWCPTCRAKVKLPCLLCYLRRAGGDVAADDGQQTPPAPNTHPPRSP